MPSNQLTRLASISIHDKLLLAHHFTEQLASGKAKSQLALARDYGVSGSWMRSICVMTWLAPKIQESIGRMSAEEADKRIRFRKLFNIAEVRNHDEQWHRFVEMVGAEG
ncbi:MAG: hypothetical protein HQL95_10560 [Magnetococcales bacterium]|nr:hypothetical protein [Magnetococcales bacterium]